MTGPGSSTSSLYLCGSISPFGFEDGLGLPELLLLLLILPGPFDVADSHDDSIVGLVDILFLNKRLTRIVEVHRVAVCGDDHARDDFRIITVE